MNNHAYSIDDHNDILTLWELDGVGKSLLSRAIEFGNSNGARTSPK